MEFLQQYQAQLEAEVAALASKNRACVEALQALLEALKVDELLKKRGVKHDFGVNDAVVDWTTYWRDTPGSRTDILRLKRKLCDVRLNYEDRALHAMLEISVCPWEKEGPSARFSIFADSEDRLLWESVLDLHDLHRCLWRIRLNDLFDPDGSHRALLDWGKKITFYLSLQDREVIEAGSTEESSALLGSFANCVYYFFTFKK